MAPQTTQGIISLRSVSTLLLVLAILALLFGPIRSWGLRSFDSNTARRREFDRRVQAQRQSVIQDDLARAGISIESEPAVTDSGAVGSTKSERRLIDRLRDWWHHLRSPAADPNRPTIPILRDSLGLLPGERAVLPDGRIVNYDTTTFRYHPQAGDR